MVNLKSLLDPVKEYTPLNLLAGDEKEHAEKGRSGVTRRRRVNEEQETADEATSVRTIDGPVKGHTRTVELKDGGRLHPHSFCKHV